VRHRFNVPGRRGVAERRRRRNVHTALGEINIDALFYPDSGPSLSLQFKSLTLVSGTVGVQSRDTYNVEADVDIQLDTETGERISITGHVLETACHLGQSKTCDN